jgi:hypothetical protein
MGAEELQTEDDDPPIGLARMIAFSGAVFAIACMGVGIWLVR